MGYMLFADSHEWIKIENDIGYVGISAYAQRELGEIVYVELPQIGKEVKAGEEVAVLESTKAAADLYSPVSGVVVAVNSAVKESPSIIHESPEGEGWLFQIRVIKAEELRSLLDRDRYTTLIQNSSSSEIVS